MISLEVINGPLDALEAEIRRYYQIDQEELDQLRRNEGGTPEIGAVFQHLGTKIRVVDMMPRPTLEWAYYVACETMDGKPYGAKYTWSPWRCLAWRMLDRECDRVDED